MNDESRPAMKIDAALLVPPDQVAARADALAATGVDIILVTTLVNGINNDQVGSIIRFALENPKKISFIAFQPVSCPSRRQQLDEVEDVPSRRPRIRLLRWSGTARHADADPR